MNKGLTLLWRTDAHLADQAPQSRKDDWTEAIFGKLTQVGEIAKEVGAKAVLDGGDLFHVKTPSRNAHQTNVRLAQVHQAYPCPTYGNVGNHDVKYGDLRFLEESPLGMLFESKVLHRCYDQFEAVFKWTEFTRDAWSDDGTGRDPEEVTVRVVGIPYHGTKYDLNRLTSITKGKENYLVVMAHLLASPQGGTMFEKEDIIPYSLLANHDADVFCFGHWHKNQGIRQISDRGRGKYIVNIGSLSRGALSEDEMARTPSVAILNFRQRGITIDERPLRVESADTVFDIEGRVRQESRAMSIGTFVDNLKDALKATEKVSLVDDVRDMPGIPDVVRERAILVLESTEQAEP